MPAWAQEKIQHGVKRCNLEKIPAHACVLTHTHMDHMGWVATILAWKFSFRVLASELFKLGGIFHVGIEAWKRVVVWLWTGRE